MNIKLLELLISSGLLILIWLIQILHYPSFRFVDPTQFTTFAGFHGARISLIVMPLMLAELGLAFYFRSPIILGLIIAIWASTFFLQVPCHNKLVVAYDPQIIERLISTNWIRTVLWTIKFCILFRRY